MRKNTREEEAEEDESSVLPVRLQRGGETSVVMADTCGQILLGSGLTVLSHPLMYIKVLVQVGVQWLNITTGCIVESGGGVDVKIVAITSEPPTDSSDRRAVIHEIQIQIKSTRIQI